ncbi:hypothetical protein SPRG_02700 [Saprolegnia parasitica CBS 223.65]|uniref:15-hydroxyprostaglandin dehydrogenase n=1 Tax=Saprolegnia parasitica (strain CBS 223.65) TaxID=695850 RepID=A0A067CZL9_SAPPC|nr:hypothetical protein SPRG_02700 [Saprolegnia parasitica CBS 223.65]KDO32222.1 hypothetical protein SPRG_02700 [Saprolegnia parasitica CBS 223.65]|eukprot:XP_012196680.1 hypothetical protein SPRG_02700 [Saprolegnia parasitica CBS 223.65]
MQHEHVVGIVTGAAQGLGLAFSKSILEGGGRVFLTDINHTVLVDAARALTAQFSAARVGYAMQDVTDDTSFDAIFDAANKHFGDHRVNLLVNNAGLNGKYFDFYDDSAAWRKLVDVNLIAVMRGTQVALRRLAKPGVIVNVASAAAFKPTHVVPEYGTTKCAVVHFTRAVAKHASDVRLVSLCPAFVDTPMVQVVLQNSARMIEAFGGLMTTEYAADAFKKVLLDETNAGKAMLVTTQHVGYHPAKL